MADPLAGKAPLTWSRVARRIRVPLGFVFAGLYIWRARPNWQSVSMGFVLAALGLLIRALASGQVKKDRELTTTGPYAYVRNPLYLGSILLGVGFVVAARDLWLAVALLLYFVVVYVPVIRAEQTYLGSQFPDYAEYQRSVPSLLPRRLWFSGAAAGFSRELYFRHREYNALLGAAAMLAVLIVKIYWLPG
ncbi:MAG: isoprenylcysteine carboxylmethyltransferase family protein [Candidatus Korobacteraceae bacterium]